MDAKAARIGRAGRPEGRIPSPLAIPFILKGMSHGCEELSVVIWGVLSKRVWVLIPDWSKVLAWNGWEQDCGRRLGSMCSMVAPRVIMRDRGLPSVFTFNNKPSVKYTKQILLSNYKVPRYQFKETRLAHDASLLTTKNYNFGKIESVGKGKDLIMSSARFNCKL